MKVLLMYRDRDFDPQEQRPVWAGELCQDLELEPLLSAMAAGDRFLFEVSRQALLTSLSEPQAIVYRQQVLTDCLQEPAIVRELYALAVEAIAREKRAWGWGLARHPEGVLLRSVETLKQFVGLLTRLRQIALEHRARFRSEGFRRLFDMFVRELDEPYLRTIEAHLRQLAFRNGVLVSAALGQGNHGTDFVLRRPSEAATSWTQRLQDWRQRLGTAQRSSHVYQVADRDESGHKALSELRSRGISTVAAALGRSSDHVLAFFGALRLELGFYVGCLNVRDRLARKQEPVCVPEVSAVSTSKLSARGLYDLSLSLQIEPRAVGNDLDADGRRLIVITGANRGGKSTFLRALGQAQLMMQAGMFVAARSFQAEAATGLFTHFKREEDPGMRSGKLDDELARMSRIVDRLTAGGILLLNESFASTNEREGSEIARQIASALLEAGIKLIYVTHLYDLAHGLYCQRLPYALFLQAERLPDGRRTFQLAPGEPAPTSYGEDLYRRIFCAGAAPTDTCGPGPTRLRVAG